MPTRCCLTACYSGALHIPFRRTSICLILPHFYEEVPFSEISPSLAKCPSFAMGSSLSVQIVIW
ncbi:predicted protein [Plenodomus lingam JN3]|uniref:Predicted protein n=1 Tax=Leptosphaeria maculans (strain JN3 / isolate v23.1.3 / race Av1-4-5-6-7-8) TaxID=985895 RepID=E5AAB1_LEPMJ|nr:predicted protein [Plenodomus lingam JN3]CBY00602.1 predicted protein [Plenodomus lingam JN3]